MNIPSRRLIQTAESDRYRRLVDAITDYAVYMLDADGFVSSWNAGARRFKGYEESEIIGQHFSMFYTEEDRNADVPKKALHTAAYEGRFEQEGWRMRKDGTRFWAHVVIDPVRDLSNCVVGFAKITRDLTERKRGEDALRKAQQALFQSQKLESIGQLTGGIAHDFNNLLTAIGMCLELVEARLPESDSRSRTLLKNAIDGVARGTTLTQRMLAFARRQELQIVPLSIAQLVTGIADLVRHALGQDVTLQIDIPDDLPLVRGDANQLETALFNLTINARDAMPDGGIVRLAARSHKMESSDALGISSDAYVCVSVSDQGHGMDAATLARAAEPFFTTKGVGKGTGLGLSMVHGLAEQSGGKLTISSQPHQGTTVELILPAAEAGAIANRHITQETPVMTALPRKGTILVVDDDRLVLTGTVAVVEDLGYVAIEATSAIAALEIIAQRVDIDLVLSDQVMPKMTGLQLAQTLAAIRPALPVVLATGFAELDSSREVLRIKRLAKPYRRQELADLLREVLG